MSRSRTIKPEFWISEQIINCSIPARLLFIGLWNFSDDHGIHPNSFLKIKAEIFPADVFSIDDIKNLLQELIDNDLIIEYSVDDKEFLMVITWKKHQKIDKPTYKYPLPKGHDDDTFWND
jgi:hypothetical protein